MFWGPLIGFTLLVLFVFTWIYGFSKKISLHKNEIQSKSLIENKALTISEKTKFIHTAVTNNNAVGFSVGGHLLQAIANTQGQEASTTVHISISDDNHKIKLNSNIKGILELRDKLIQLELEYVLPSLKILHNSGITLHFGAIQLQNKHLLVGKRKLGLNEFDSIEFEKGKMIFKSKIKRLALAKVKTKKIHNMHSFLELILK